MDREGESLYHEKDNENSIVPVEYEGIKTMSFGYAKRGKAAMRGNIIIIMWTIIIVIIKYNKKK